MSTATWNGLEGLEPRMLLSAAVTFVDQDDDRFTVRLSGPGTLAVSRVDAIADNKGPIDTIELGGTDATSKLTVTVRQKLAGDGIVNIGGITGGQLRSISATKSDLDGDGIGLSGHLGSLKIRDVTDGADISTGGDGTLTTKITAKMIGSAPDADSDNDSDITVGSILASLTAVTIGQGTITAPSAIKITAKGSKAPVVNGDFSATLNLTDEAAQWTLDTLKVMHSMLGATVNAAATIRSVTAGTIMNSDIFAGVELQDEEVDPEPDTTAPTVLSTDPANSAVGVQINRRIGVTFSEAMDNASITTTTFTVSAPGPVAVEGTVEYSDNMATFIPTAGSFAADTVFTATVTTGATDAAGNPLAGNFVWTFTTGSTSDTTAPTVVATDPVDGATFVGTNKVISATFSETMDAETITDTTFKVTGPDTTEVEGTLTVSGSTVTFTPTDNLAANTTFTLTVTTGAKDLAGVALAGNFSSTFTTSANPDPRLPDSADDFANKLTGKIASVVVKGIATPGFWFVNSNIAAWKLGSIKIANADESNGGVPFGGACNRVASFVYNAADGSLIDKVVNSNSTNQVLDPHGDLVLRFF